MNGATTVWEDTYSLDTFDSDWTGQATLQFVCRAMQETAWHHAESIGFNLTHMERNDIIWILSRQQIRIHSLPQWKDSVTVRTWYAGREKLLFHRDFELLNSDGAVLVSASTAWIALDVQRRRPVRTEQINHGLPADRPRAVDDPWEALPKLGEARKGEPFRVFARDLDMSRHANNVCYPEWLLEPLPLEYREGHDLASFDIAYQTEAVHGEQLVSFLVEESPESFLHGIVRTTDGKAVSTARSGWHKRSQPRPSGWERPGSK